MGLAAAGVFAFLYLIGALNAIENRIYDFFLHFRADRQLLEDVVFLNVDDNSISYYGIFPWPRSIYGDGLLRLKEYEARAAIFDIEFMDSGHKGVDLHYLNYEMERDFFRSFSEIDILTNDLLAAIRAGQIGISEINSFTTPLSSLISNERQTLFNNVQNVARDNDLYFSQAIALYGRSWSTIRMESNPLSVSDADRRLLAEENFSVPVDAADNVKLGGGFIEITTALPVLSKAAKGAGFTNAVVDKDGVRRRVYLVQNIHDHWYPQLSFAPMLEYLGNPELTLEKRKLTLKQIKLPGGGEKDIVIPLDHEGRLMLDWPKENYFDCFTHFSFASFSALDQIESELEMYSRALSSAEWMFFAQFDPSLREISEVLNEVCGILDAAREVKSHAMENASEDSFKTYIEYRDYAYELLGEVFAAGTDAAIRELSVLLREEYPDTADSIENETGYILSLLEALEALQKKYKEMTASLSASLRGKFVIIGRVDTGTTDFGVNPFHGNFINVGTHGVVLDTILSESFIIPLSFWWSILLMVIFVPLFFLISSNFPPVIRAASGLASVLLILILLILLFRFTGIFLGPVGAILSMLTAIIIREVVSYASSEKEKKFIRTAFSTYVSDEIVKEIISDPSRLQLGGTKRYMSAIFTDVQGFSSISEKLDPEDLVSLLNKYLSAMSDVVLAERGTIDKYEGDAIIAFFGAPLELPDHALRACASAIAMKKLEVELNKTIMEQKLSPNPLLTRIGINTGYMVAGNMGTANKMNYTIMGNAVNLAARLEGVNKQYGTFILTSEATLQETGDHLLYRKLDRIRVVGINEPVRLCELVDMAAIADELDKKRVSVFHEALDKFEGRSWRLAAEGFREVLSIKPDDHPSKLYFDRCRNFIKTPPLDSWDGVYNMTSK